MGIAAVSSSRRGWSDQVAGAYCKFCDHRCFVYRVLPNLSWSGHLATCRAGREHDRRQLGVDCDGALNPFPHGELTAGMVVRFVAPNRAGGAWQVTDALIVQTGEQVLFTSTRFPAPTVLPADAVVECPKERSAA